MPFDALFIRHAESLSNVGGVTDHPGTYSLTENGHQQAGELAASISVVPKIIVYSPFLRAYQTAEPLLARFPEAESLSLPIQEFTYLIPEAWRQSTGADRRPAVDAYWQRADPHWCDGGGAESFAEFMGRAEAVLGWLTIRGTGPVFLVCHELFIRAVMWRCLAPSLERAVATMTAFRAWQFGAPLPNTSVTRISSTITGAVSVSPPFVLTRNASHAWAVPQGKNGGDH